MELRQGLGVLCVAAGGSGTSHSHAMSPFYGHIASVSHVACCNYIINLKTHVSTAHAAAASGCAPAPPADAACRRAHSQEPSAPGNTQAPHSSSCTQVV